MTRIFFCTIVLLFSFTLLLAQSTSEADKIVGTWLSENKDGKVDIYKVGNKYFGKLIWGKMIFEADGVTSKKDINNKDDNQRSRNLKGLVILSEFVYNDGVWEGGKIYDPQIGKTYSCIIKLNNNVLIIRGYVGISLFGRTTEWTRVR